MMPLNEKDTEKLTARLQAQISALAESIATHSGLAAVRAKDKATGKDVLVLCAVRTSPEGLMMAPLFRLFESDDPHDEVEFDKEEFVRTTPEQTKAATANAVDLYEAPATVQ